MRAIVADPIPPERTAWTIRLTQEPVPHEATRWTLRAMAKAAGLAASTVQGIWKAHGLSPHRWRSFTLCSDPAFAGKLTTIVGFSAKLTWRRLKHGVFRSVVDLPVAINRFVKEYNAENPKPFVWNANPDVIIAARNRGFQVLESIHWRPVAPWQGRREGS